MRIRKDCKKNIEESKKNSFWKFSFRKPMDRKVLSSKNKTDNKKVNKTLNDVSSSQSDYESEALKLSPVKVNEKEKPEETESENDSNIIPNRSSSPTNHIKLARQLDILSFESDDETLPSETEDVFTSLSKLTTPSNAVQLSVFINFTIVHCRSEPILFYLITDLYKKGNLKDMRKWAYEIFSSFVSTQAPLQFLAPEQQEVISNEIDSKLVQIEVYKPASCVTSSFDFEMLRLLREIFQKSRAEAQKIISQQLQDYQNKRNAGLEAMYGGSSNDMKAAKKNRLLQQKIIEKNLMPKLLMMLEESEEFNQQKKDKMILVSALSTVIHQTFRPRTNYFEPIDQFVSCENVLKRKEINAKGHQLIPKICYSTTYCDYCLKTLWGIVPQGYECECGIKIHESCIDELKGTCILYCEDDELANDSQNESKDSTKLMELVQMTLGNQRIEDYKRSKSNRPKSDPGLYRSSEQTDSSSDDDTTLTETVWNPDVALEFPKLSETAKKRRDIIYELFETEKRHVKILKLLQNVFMEPLKRSKAFTPELSNMLFPSSFLVIKDWHVTFETMLKKENHEQNGILLEIGNCLSIFEGSYGDILKENAASFCAGQQIALETLRIHRSKNEMLQRGLIKAESHKGCKRLQLKDLMLSIFQRLTKYPLLFERILKYAKEDENIKIQKALESSKMILSYVNNTVRNSDEIRLIQSKLDKTAFEREAPQEYKNINLLDFKLIHDGYLILKKGAIPMRVLLFEQILVLLFKQDDKYFLKTFENLKTPIMKINQVIVRSNAVDPKSFYLIYQTDRNSQMIELIASNEVNSLMWIEKVNIAIDKAYQSLSLLRRSSAESAQQILRSESKTKYDMKKPSDLAMIVSAMHSQTKNLEEWIQTNIKSVCPENSDQLDGIDISQSINHFSRLVSQLSMKIAERDHERELYLKENQRLREQQH